MALTSTRTVMQDVAGKSKTDERKRQAEVAAAAAQERGKTLTTKLKNTQTGDKTSALSENLGLLIGQGLNNVGGKITTYAKEKTDAGKSAGGSGTGTVAAAPVPAAPAAAAGSAQPTAYDLALQKANAAANGMPVYTPGQYAVGVMPTYQAKQYDIGEMPTYQARQFDIGERPEYEASVDRAAEQQARGLYDEAAANLAKANDGRPVYSGSFDDQIKALYDQINGRGEFNFDLNGDAFWQQYKDQYTQQAKNAMRDTMGQAAALTGGYGSSYGQAVGQQAYDRRIEELMDKAPELYDRAYQRYQDEGTRMQQQLALARNMANDEYNKYQDADNRWLNDRAYAQNQADAAYNRYLTERQLADQQEARDYSRYQDQMNIWQNEQNRADKMEAQDYDRYLNQLSQWQNERNRNDQMEAQDYARYQDQLSQWRADQSLANQQEQQDYNRYLDRYNQWQNERAYADKQLDAALSQQKDNLATLQAFMAMGYTPTAQEIADAGLNNAQYQALVSAMSQPAATGGGNNGGLQYIRDLQKQANAMGANLKVDGVAGKKTLAALKKYGLLDGGDTESETAVGSYDQALADMQAAIAEGADRYEINTAIVANNSLTAEEKRRLMDQNNAPTSDRYVFDR